MRTVLRSKYREFGVTLREFSKPVEFLHSRTVEPSYHNTTMFASQFARCLPNVQRHVASPFPESDKTKLASYYWLQALFSASEPEQGGGETVGDAKIVEILGFALRKALQKGRHGVWGADGWVVFKETG